MMIRDYWLFLFFSFIFLSFEEEEEEEEIYFIPKQVHIYGWTKRKGGRWSGAGNWGERD